MQCYYTFVGITEPPAYYLLRISFRGSSVVDDPDSFFNFSPTMPLGESVAVPFSLVTKVACSFKGLRARVHTCFHSEDLVGAFNSLSLVAARSFLVRVGGG